MTEHARVQLGWGMDSGSKVTKGKTKNVGFLLNQARIDRILAEGRRG